MGYTKNELIALKTIEENRLVPFSVIIDSKGIITDSIGEPSFNLSALKKGANLFKILPDFRNKIASFDSAGPVKDNAVIDRANNVSIDILIAPCGTDCKEKTTIIIFGTYHSADPDSVEDAEMLRALINATPDIICLKDGSNRYLETNMAFDKLFEISSHEVMIGKTNEELKNLVSDKSLEMLVNCSGFDEEIWLKKKIFMNEEHFPGNNGQDRIIEVTKVPIYFEDGTRKGLVTIARDITQTKKIMEELLQSENKFRQTINLLPVGIFEFDLGGHFTFANSYAIEMFGYNPDVHLPDINVIDLLAFEEREKAMTRIALVIQNTGSVLTSEYMGMKQDGTKFPIEIHSTCIMKNGKPTGLRGAIIDTTLKKKLEEELIKKNKLESIGVLAGGIAHDFNNILTVIIGNISLAKFDIPATDEKFEMLSTAEEASLRAKNLTHQLLTFSRGGEPVKENADLVEIIRESSSFVMRGSKSECRYEFSEGIWPVELDKAQFSRVIQNLIINADQAMQSGGIITLRVSNVKIDMNSKLPVKAGRYVKVIIEDTGPGLPPGSIDKIFDPYYSTRDFQSGLGLSVCYTIVKKHNGYIEVSSEKGKGAQFTIYLPAIKNQEYQGQKAESDVIDGDAKGAIKVLIMDDEAAVRTVASEMIKLFGYDVAAAANGVEAVEMIKMARNEGAPFTHIVVDLTIPGGMGGVEAARIIREFDSEMRIIVSTGYSNDPVMTEFEKYGFTDYIAKPFTLEDMRRVIY